MILGMTPLVFIHVLISLIGIVTGFVVAAGLLGNRRYDGWTAVFLVTTIATSVTGFMLPFTQLLPSHIFGFISLAVLPVAVIARYAKQMAGSWRWIYVATAMFALYLNTFVLVVQVFLKVPAANALAPTQSEPAFLIAQLILLALFLFVVARGIFRFAPVSALPAAASHA